MSIKATLHPVLNKGTELQLDVEGKTVGECLDAVIKQFPAIGKEMFEEKDVLKKHVGVLVNGESTSPRELNFPVKDGDSIVVLAFLAGG